MLQQTPYDFSLLVATIYQASPQDIVAALNHDMTHESALRDVLTQFRKDFTPGNITVGMHFNYRHLLRAFEVYDQECRNFSTGMNYHKNKIFCCQVIGFIQRSLPAIDRMVFAQSLYEVIEKNAEIKRSFKFTHGARDFPEFPVTASGYSVHSGLGFNFFAWGLVLEGNSGVTTRFEKLLSKKNLSIVELMQHREEKTSWCVMC
jgi:hypothetical protein